MKRQKLTVEKRNVFGQKLKKIRREGILPANIYGKDIKSQSVQVALKDFQKVFAEAGETSLIDLEVEGKTLPVLIHNVQINYMSRMPLHADFYQVNLKEKVKTMVPILVTGEAKAVADKIGLLLQPMSEVEVEALPEDLPENIEVDVEGLAAIDQQITVGELKLPKGVEVLTDKEQVVVKIGELITKEAAEEAAKVQAEAEAAKAETGEAPEGEAKAEEPVRNASQSDAGGKPQPEAPKEEGK